MVMIQYRHLWQSVCATLSPSPVQVLKGSHHLGRIDHVRVGDQVGADLERVEQVKKVSVHVLSCVESSHACS